MKVLKVLVRYPTGAATAAGSSRYELEHDCYSPAVNCFVLRMHAGKSYAR